MSNRLHLPPAAEHLEGHVAIALAQARACRPLIRDEVIPRLQPLKRSGAERLLREIDGRTIVSERGASELAALLERIEIAAANGTTSTTMWSTDPCDVGEPSAWTETHMTQDALVLAAARCELASLHRAIMLVLDLVHAARVLERLAKTA